MTGRDRDVIRLEDLDRCEHGRHSIDHCYDCPGGQSTGNLRLAVFHDLGDEGVILVQDAAVTIGHTYDGQPIVVVPVRRPREA